MAEAIELQRTSEEPAQTNDTQKSKDVASLSSPPESPSDTHSDSETPETMASATGIPEQNYSSEDRREDEPLLGESGDAAQKEGKGIQFNFVIGMWIHRTLSESLSYPTSCRHCCDCPSRHLDRES